MRTDDHTGLRDSAPEPGPQPEPYESRSGATRTWAVTGVIVAVVLAVMYGVTAHRVEVKDEQHQTERQHEAAPPVSAPASPATAKPGG
jgi:hypothetical protein